MAIKLQGTNSVAAPGLTNDGGDGVVVGTDSVDISIGGVSKVNVDSSGNTTCSGKVHITDDLTSGQLLVGTSTSDATTKYGTFNVPHKTNSEEPVMVIGAESTTSDSQAVYIGGGFSTQNAAKHIRFYTAANTTTVTGTQRATIDSDGLKFNADTAAANALDDYEEGTHTTALVGSGSLYSGANGLSYTKIGNVVTVSGQVRVNTGDAGDIQLTLPFSAGSNVNDDSHNFVGSLNIYSSVVHASNVAQGICTQIGAGTNHVSFMAAWHDSTWTALPTTADGYYRFTITYFTA